MPKKIVQDVLPPEGRSIRNVPLPPKRQPVRSAPAPERKQLDSRVDGKRPSAGVSYQKSRPRFWLWGVVAVCVLVLLFFGSLVFSKAELAVTPRSEKVAVDASLVAKKAPAAGELGYEVVTLSREAGKVVEASGEEKVDKKASGKIRIYNKHSAASQKLIASTRFETPQGLIFRIADAVTVPGYTKKGTEIVPGSVSVTVYADKAGEAYNIGLTDFTVPGFKGDSRYTNIFARSETAMQGGFSGVMKKVTPETLEKTQADLQAQLKSELLAEARSQIPNTFVLYESAVSFEFESLSQSEVTDTSVKINEKGTLTGIMFDKAELQTDLALNEIDGDSSGVYVSNLDSLVVTLPGTPASLADSAKDVTFTVGGNATFIWTFDAEMLKAELAGKSKKELGSVLSKYPAIERAQASFTVPWKGSFPKNPSKINIDVKGVD